MSEAPDTDTHSHSHDHSHHHHDESLNKMSMSATLHCLTGCALGEVTGMALFRIF